MTNIPMERREFIKRLGVGAAAVGLSQSSAGFIGKTPGGVVVDSPGEFGGFLVEKIVDPNFPYEYDPKILKRMSEKSTTFSRNVWDPDRQNRPESGEDIAYLNLVEGKGQIPNQTRLDYALMTASWHMANVHSRASYQWELHRGMVRGLGLHELGPWDPAELDMNWEEASLAVKHAALFYGAVSRADVALHAFVFLFLVKQGFVHNRDIILRFK